MTTAERDLRLEEHDGGWQLVGSAAAYFGLANDDLAYLRDRNYSPRTVRAYGFDLLAFCRWLHGQGQTLEAVTTDVLLAYLGACRAARLAGRAGPNVVWIRGERLDGYAATTINHRLAAIWGLYGFRVMRDPAATSPVPKGRQTRWVTSAERGGLLGHLAARSLGRGCGCVSRGGCQAAGPRAGRGAARELSDLQGSGDRRADAVLRAACRRGAGAGGHRRRCRWPLLRGWGKGAKERRCRWIPTLAG